MEEKKGDWRDAQLPNTRCLTTMLLGRLILPQKPWPKTSSEVHLTAVMLHSAVGYCNHDWLDGMETKSKLGFNQELV